MQKFPLRMKDNDLLVTELYKDPSEDMVTSLSVYLTPKTSKYYHGNNVNKLASCTTFTDLNVYLSPETSKCYHGNNVIQISFLHIIFTDLSFYIT